MNEATGAADGKVEVKEVTESEALAAGFKGDLSEVSIIPTPQKNEDAQEETTGTKPADDAATANGTETTTATNTPEVPDPNTPVVITQAQMADIQARLAGIDSLRGDLIKRSDTALGKYGELNRSLQELKQRPAGGFDMSKAQFKKLSEQFPEFAKLIAEDMADSFGSQAQAVLPQTVKPEELEAKFNQQLAAATESLTVKYEKREIGRKYKDWEQTVRSKEFQDWGKTLPPEDWKNFVESYDSDVVISKLDAYAAHTAAEKQKAEKATKDAADAATAAARKKGAQNRLAAAVTPQGNATGPTGKSESDLLNEGFNSVRKAA